MGSGRGGMGSGRGGIGSGRGSAGSGPGMGSGRGRGAGGEQPGLVGVEPPGVEDAARVSRLDLGTVELVPVGQAVGRQVVER